MSKSWEEVAELTGGEMVGGSLIVASGHATRTSYGQFIDGQFVYTLEGLAFLRELEAPASPTVELVSELEPVVDADEVVEVKTETETEADEATQPSLEDLLG